MGIKKKERATTSTQESVNTNYSMNKIQYITERQHKKKCYAA